LIGIAFWLGFHLQIILEGLTAQYFDSSAVWFVNARNFQISEHIEDSPWKYFAKMQIPRVFDSVAL
jgi:hypothetical protein